MTTQTFDKVQEKFSTNRATQVVSIVSTKGGVGKTTLAANMSALIADFGFRVLMIDADVQPSLSKYYPLSYTAPNGIVELMLGENNDNNIRSCISRTVYPNLDIVLSNNISGEIQTKIQVRPDRAVLLKSKLIHPIIRSYDFVIIDTQGAVGALQDAAAFAADLLLSPVMPETLSAREFLSGTNEMLNRLSYGEAIGLRVPPLFALIYNQDRTRDSKEITAEIRNYFNQFVDGKQRLLNTIIPRAKAYKEAASLRLPVHCHDRYQTNRSECAYDIMHHLVYEIWSAMGERKLEASCFDGGANLLPVEDLSGLPESGVSVSDLSLTDTPLRAEQSTAWQSNQNSSGTPNHTAADTAVSEIPVDWHSVLHQCTQELLALVHLSDYFVLSNKFPFGFYIEYPDFKQLANLPLPENYLATAIIDRLHQDAGDIWILLAKISKQEMYMKSGSSIHNNPIIQLPSSSRLLRAFNDEEYATNIEWNYIGDRALLSNKLITWLSNSSDEIGILLQKIFNSLQRITHSGA